MNHQTRKTQRYTYNRAVASITGIGRARERLRHSRRNGFIRFWFDCCTQPSIVAQNLAIGASYTGGLRLQQNRRSPTHPCGTHHGLLAQYSLLIHSGNGHNWSVVVTRADSLGTTTISSFFSMFWVAMSPAVENRAALLSKYA